MPDRDRHDLVATVIIPVLNEEGNIAEAIRSAVGDGRADVEVLVIDDHSTDSTAEIAAAIPFVRVITNDGNGLADGMNTGLRQSSTEIVVCLDADDRLRDGAVDRLIQPFLVDPDLVLVYGGTTIVDVAGNPIATQGSLPTLDHMRVVAMAVNPVTQSGATMRRTPVLEIGGYRREGDIEGALDYDLWSRAFEAGLPMTSIDDVVCDRLIHADSMTVRGRSSQFARADRIRLRNRQLWADDYLHAGRLRRLGHELVEGDSSLFNLWVMSMCRLTVAMLAARRPVRAVHAATPLLTLGPLRTARGVWCKIRELQSERSVRGWSRWRR